MKVRLLPGGDVVSLDVGKGVRASKLLKLLDLSPEEAVVLVDGRPLTEDDVVPEGSEVVVVRVASGG